MFRGRSIASALLLCCAGCGSGDLASDFASQVVDVPGPGGDSACPVGSYTSYVPAIQLPVMAEANFSPVPVNVSVASYSATGELLDQSSQTLEPFYKGLTTNPSGTTSSRSLVIQSNVPSSCFHVLVSYGAYGIGAPSEAFTSAEVPALQSHKHRTGVALFNPSDVDQTVTLEAHGAVENATRCSQSFTIPAKSTVSKYLDGYCGWSETTLPFLGSVKVTAPGAIAGVSVQENDETGGKLLVQFH